MFKISKTTTTIKLSYSLVLRAQRKKKVHLRVCSPLCSNSLFFSFSFMCIDCMSSRVLSLNKDVSRGGGVKGSRGNLRQLEGGKGKKKTQTISAKKKKTAYYKRECGRENQRTAVKRISQKSNNSMPSFWQSTFLSLQRSLSSFDNLAF